MNEKRSISAHDIGDLRRNQNELNKRLFDKMRLGQLATEHLWQMVHDRMRKLGNEGWAPSALQDVVNLSTMACDMGEALSAEARFQWRALIADLAEATLNTRVRVELADAGLLQDGGLTGGAVSSETDIESAYGHACSAFLEATALADGVTKRRNEKAAD